MFKKGNFVRLKKDMSLYNAHYRKCLEMGDVCPTTQYRIGNSFVNQDIPQMIPFYKGEQGTIVDVDEVLEEYVVKMYKQPGYTYYFHTEDLELVPEGEEVVELILCHEEDDQGRPLAEDVDGLLYVLIFTGIRDSNYWCLLNAEGLPGLKVNGVLVDFFTDE